MAVAGIDIGTTSLCGVLVEDGRLKAVQSVPNSAGITAEKSYERLQDPDEILRLVQGILEQLCLQATPTAIAVTGQMHGILYVDSQGQAVSPLFTWQDGRGDLPGGDGVPFAGALSARCGSTLHTGHGLCTHAWLAQNNAMPKNAAFLCTIGDYIALRLAGASRPATDASLAASLGFFDLAQGRFDEQALGRAGISSRLLPPIVPAGTILGQTKNGARVLCAIGDNQASFAGSVQDVHNTVCFNVGTGSQVSAWYPKLLPTANAEARPFPGGGYLYVAASLNGGRALAALADFMHQLAKELGNGAPQRPYAAIDRLAAQEGPALTVEPNLYGRIRGEKPNGSITGITAESFTPGALVRGYIQGMARELLAMLHSLPAEVAEGKTRFVCAGNGLRKNAPLRAALAKGLGTQPALSEIQEEAAYGAARLAEEAL